MLQKRFLAMLGAIVLVLAACGPAATPTTAPAQATPTSAPAPAATLPPVATSVATPAPRPSLTPTPAVTQPSGPKMGGILRWGATNEPVGPDPHRFTRRDVYDHLTYIHSRLLRYNFSQPGCGSFPLEPELATKWEWVNDKTLDVTLRQGVKFHPKPPVNGREFTAEDVVYVATNQWPKSPVIAVPLKAQLDNVQAVERYKVRFNFKMPAPYFPSAVMAYSLSLVTPREVLGSKGDIEKLEHNIGLGPYMFKEHIPGVKFELEKNPNYFREGIPRPDGLVAHITPDYSTQLSALRSGRLDFTWFTGLPALVEQTQRTAPQLQVITCPQGAPLGLNIRSDKAPFNDVRVRRAIAMGIDREVLMKAAFLGKAIPSWTTVPPAFTEWYIDRKDFPPELRQYLEYNPDRAKQLLAEAGYPQGFSTSLRHTFVYPEQVPVVEGLVDLLSRIGIKVSLDMVDRATYTETVYTGKYPELSVSWLNGGDSPQAVVWNNFHSTGGGNNHSRVNDPDMDRWLEEWQITADPKRGAELVRQMLFRQVDQAWYVTLLQPDNVLLAQPYVKVPVFKTTNKTDSDWAMWMWRE